MRSGWANTLCGLLQEWWKGGAGNTDGVSKSKQQLSMGFGLFLLTLVPLASPLPLGKYSGCALYTAPTSCCLLSQNPTHAGLFVFTLCMPGPSPPLTHHPSSGFITRCCLNLFHSCLCVCVVFFFFFPLHTLKHLKTISPRLIWIT